MQSASISFVTVCMNRLPHLRETLTANLAQCQTVEGLEFVVLDYGSTDGLEAWVMQELGAELEAGRLVYYRTEDPKHFDRSHSRNLAFKLCNGKVICNVDADNFLGEGFAQSVLETFNNEEQCFLTPDCDKQFYYVRDVIGRVSVRKEDFLKVRGYDEEMQGYGFEDNDFYSRLKSAGLKQSIVQEMSHLQAIAHQDEDRVGNEFLASQLDSFFIHYQDQNSSKVLLLHKDGSFRFGTVLPNKQGTPTHLLVDEAWEEGTWTKEGTQVSLTKNSKVKVCLDSVEMGLRGKGGEVFYRITDPSFLQFLGIQIPLITNQAKYFRNQKGLSTINTSGFGRGKVVRNGIETIEVV